MYQFAIHTTTRLGTLAAVVCLLWIASDCLAQKVPDTRSHRYIPHGQQPTRDALKTQDLVDLKQIRDIMRRASSVDRRNARKPNGFSPETLDPAVVDQLGLPNDLKQMLENAADDPEFKKAFADIARWQQQEQQRRRAGGDPQPTGLEQIDPAILNDLVPDTNKLIRDATRESMGEFFDDVGESVNTLNNRWRQSMGLDPASSQGESIEFDPIKDLDRAYRDISKSYGEQNRELNKQLSEAKKRYKELWPSEKIPPREWLTKVQPFINSEVLDQLKDWRKYKDGLADMPELERPATSGLPNFNQEKGLSTRMIESIVKSVDSTGNEIIKRAKRQQKKNGRRPSIWSRVKKATESGVKSLNNDVKNRTEKLSQSPRVITGPTSGSSGGSGPSSGGISPTGSSASDMPTSSLPIILGVIGIVVLAGIGFFWLYQQQDTEAADQSDLGPMDAHLIQDKDTMIRAVHSAAARLFGFSSRFWHHRRLFNKLSTHPSCVADASLSDSLPTLAQLYERARYAPNGEDLSRDELRVARSWYEKMQTAEAQTVQP